MPFIVGKKLKMTQVWQDGKIVPVTIVEAQPNKVSAIFEKEKHGYEAVQVKAKAQGKTSRLKEFRNREWMPVEISKFKIGDEVAVDVFKEGDKVRVSGITKGRGFQGVVKRHGFAGGPKTHGQKNRFRAPGSIGSTAFQRVVPGRRMAGRMGGDRVTVKNLVVAQIDKEKGLIFLKGAVPGSRGGIIEIRN